MRKRQVNTKSEGVRWADGQESKTEEYNIKKVLGRAMEEELLERDHCGKM